MRTIISNELSNAHINHIYGEYEKQCKLFIYIKEKDINKVEEIMNILGDLVEKVPSYIEYKVMNWTIIVKVDR